MVEAYRFRKRRLFSVISVSLLHYSILLALCWTGKALRSVNWISLTFWGCAIFTLISYYKCCFMNPGFQTHCVSEYLPEATRCQIPQTKERAAQLLREKAGQANAKHIGFADPVDILIAQVNESKPGTSNEDDEEEAGTSSYYIDEASPLENQVIVDFSSPEEPSARRLHLEERNKETAATPLNRENDVILRTDAGSRHDVVLSLEVQQEAAEPILGSWRARFYSLWFNLRRKPVNLFYTILYFFVSFMWTMLCMADICILPCKPSGVLTRWRLPHDISSRSAPSRASDILTLGVSAIYQCNEKLWYCDRCDIFRPLRSKHCSDCGYCVRMYDHHCPWIGVCVGERNRGWYCYFLLWQSIELAYALILGIWFTIADSEWLESRKPQVSDILPHVYLMFMTIIMFSLMCMTASLFVMHLLLVLANVTTWELTSWKRISYLKAHDRTKGSPFGTPHVVHNVSLALQIPQSLGSNLTCKKNAWKPQSYTHLQKYVIGDIDQELFWLPSKPDNNGLRAPRCIANDCCNLFELCA